MESTLSGFIAYPSEPSIIGETIESAVQNSRNEIKIAFETWRELDIPGRFIAEQILEKISSKDCLVADISVLNFNVIFEIGFAIGIGKRILIIRNKAIQAGLDDIRELGIFDTIGYFSYENHLDLSSILVSIPDLNPIDLNLSTLNRKAPVYLLDAKFKTDKVLRINSRIKKAGLFFRSFDPNEHTRMSGPDAIAQVAQSIGVIVSLLPNEIADYRMHNFRAAFLAGLAEGMAKELRILQLGEGPIPIDYRDLVKLCLNIDKINDVIAEVAPRITEGVQAEESVAISEPKTFLQKLDLGASAAENEFRELGEYYLETDAFRSAYRGEIRVVLGRKGSGKTALFAQVRNNVRENKKNIVIDLKPESYKLLKFKEDILLLLQEGTFEHTLMAFWEYILLLEICYKILEKDQHRHLKDHTIYEPYRKLSALYNSDEYVIEGDFSERMSKLLSSITTDFQSKYGVDSSQKRLTQAEITDLLYKHNIRQLTEELQNYLQLKNGIWLLIDNLDKGWPTDGVQKEDLAIIRTLLEATRKLERQLNARNIDCKTLVFLRNDVYEILVNETPDRGKESKVVLDWTDPDLLREMLRKRFVYNELPLESDFFNVWSKIIISHVDGEESSQYLIDRCLMRPRALIDCLKTCKSFAVNLGHEKIEESDIRKGLEAFSRDMVQEISLEIRDVFPNVNDAVYLFIGSPAIISEDQLMLLFQGENIPENDCSKLLDLLLWYGVLGFVDPANETHYIYSTSYNVKLLKGLPKVWRQTRPLYGVNPVFWPALYIQK